MSLDPTIDRRFWRAILLFALILIGAMVVASTDAASNEVKSYIVIMAQDPVIAYEGDQPGLAATKPGKGSKVNPNSAHVRRYQEHLEAQHAASLQEAGASEAQKVHDYAIALNGTQPF